MQYKNKKGKWVYVEVTHHSIYSFQKRFNTYFGIEPSISDCNTMLITRFQNADTVKNLTKKERQRIKKYPQTLFFRDETFTYVVENGVLKTVEISVKGERKLNKI